TRRTIRIDDGRRVVLLPLLTLLRTVIRLLLIRTVFLPALLRAALLRALEQTLAEIHDLAQSTHRSTSISLSGPSCPRRAPSRSGVRGPPAAPGSARDAA